MKLTFVALCLAFSAFAQTKPLFQENFESGQIDDKVWEKRMAGTATIQVQQDQAAHGKYALQIHYPEMSTQTYAFLINPHLPEAVKTHFFGRAYVKIAPATPPSHTVLVLSGAAGWPLSKFDEIGVSRNAVQPSYQENKSARGQGRGEDVRHGDLLPLDKWFLLEWEFNDNPSSLTVWVDGKLSQVTEKDKTGQPQKVDASTFKWPAGTDNSANLVGGFEEFGVGVRVWGGATPAAFDVYYDDIALGAERLGPVK